MSALGSRSPFLSIADYDAREKAARIAATYPALRSFAPVSFNAVGFPTNVSVESELRRYVDIMGETADREHWRKSLICSKEEKELVLGLRDQVEDACGALFGLKLQPFMSLLTCFPIVRFVEAVSAHAGRKLRVLEIGPGSGGLGAYLLKLGHTYFGVEVTQALYLWQHRLFNWVSDGDFQDFALRDSMPRGGPTARAAMIPWWQFAEFFRAPPLGVDIVICDAALGEMDPFAARHTIRLAKLLLKDADIGLFVYQHLGEQRQNNDAFVESYLRFNGYRSFAGGGVRAHMASESGPEALLRSFSTGVPAIGGGTAEFPVGDFLQFDPTTAAEGYAFFDFLDIHRENEPVPPSESTVAAQPSVAPPPEAAAQGSDSGPASGESLESSATVTTTAGAAPAAAAPELPIPAKTPTSWVARHFDNAMFVFVYSCDLLGLAISTIVARFLIPGAAGRSIDGAQMAVTLVAIASGALPLFGIYSGRERLASANGLMNLAMAISTAVLLGLFFVHALGLAGAVEPILPASIIVISTFILAGARLVLRHLRG